MKQLVVSKHSIERVTSAVITKADIILACDKLIKLYRFNLPGINGYFKIKSYDITFIFDVRLEDITLVTMYTKQPVTRLNLDYTEHTICVYQGICNTDRMNISFPAQYRYIPKHKEHPEHSKQFVESAPALQYVTVHIRATVAEYGLTDIAPVDGTLTLIDYITTTKRIAKLDPGTKITATIRVMEDGTVDKVRNVAVIPTKESL